MTATGVFAIAAVVSIAAGAWYLYSKRKVIAQAVNPASDQNVAYQGANAVAQAVSGDPNTTYGGWLYDLNPLNWYTNWKIAQLSKPLSSTTPAARTNAPGAPATSPQPGLGAGPAPSFDQYSLTDPQYG